MPQLPDDPAAFVAAAERAINEYDVEAAVEAYAPGATVEMIGDGTREVGTGAAGIRTFWSGYIDAMRRTRFTLRKTLVSAADGTVVNTWESDFGGRTRGRGIETWRFDEKGRVEHHVMYAFLEVLPMSSPVARLRAFVAHPRLSVTFLRSLARARRGG